MKRSAKRKIPRKNSTAPVTLPITTWDMGAMGAANRIGLVEEERGETDPATGKMINPNGVRGVRRVDMLVTYWKRGVIDTRQLGAAVALRDAFEATGKAPGWPESERVDSSPKPDHAVTIQIDRLSAYHRIAKLVILHDKPIIDAVVLSGCGPASIKRYRGPRYQDGLQHLRDALDRLATALGA